MRADSLPAMGRLDKEFVNPRSLAAIFEAVVETDHQIPDQRGFFAKKVDDAIDGILQKFGEIRADCGLLEWFRPGIILLHLAHHDN